MITTLEELHARIKELAGEQFNERVKYETTTPNLRRKENRVVYWFVAMRQSATLSEQADDKEIAWLFMDGLAPMDQEGVEDWLQTLYQDDDWDESEKEKRKEEAMLALDTWIKLHFRVES